MIIISNFGASDLKNLRTGKIFTEHVEKWRFPGAPLPMLPHPRLTSGPAVSAPKENVEGDHGLVEIRLEGGVSPLRQPAVAQIALQTLYHALDGGPPGHRGFESLRHPGILRIDVGKQVERHCGRPAALRVRTAFRPVRAAQADRGPVLPDGGSLVYESPGFVSLSSVIHVFVTHSLWSVHQAYLPRSVTAEVVMAKGKRTSRIRWRPMLRRSRVTSE